MVIYKPSLLNYRSSLAPFLTRNFNKCINEVTCPNCLNIFQMTPIYKSGDQTRCTDYRPIFILLQFNKFLKNFCMLECIHICKNWIYYQNINMDTDRDLQLLIPPLNNSDNGLYTCSIFIDLSKAFDTVPITSKFYLKGWTSTLG